MPTRHLHTAALLVLPLACVAPALAAQSTAGGTIQGLAWDSVASRPLGAATVQVVAMSPGAQPQTVTAGADGRFRLAGLAAGRYTAMVVHPRLDALGVELPARTVVVPETGEARLDFALPGGLAFLRLACPSPRDSTGAIMGVVSDPDTEAPLPGATVVAEWAELVVDWGGVRRERRVASTRAEAGGRYRLCNLPTDAPVTVQAVRGRATTGELQVQPPRGVAVLDLAISSSVLLPDTTAEARRTSRPPTGSASVAVRVRGDDGKAVPGARLYVWGTAAYAVTDAEGRATLTGLPSGSWMVEARRVGLGMSRQAVTLSAREPAQVELLMRPLARTLDVVTVYGKRSGVSSGFMQRQRAGFGTFITKDIIEERKPLQTSDLLRNIPGVTVRQDPRGFRQRLQMRGGCLPSVVLDGQRLEDDADLDRFIRPAELAGVEVYTDATGAPPQFQRNSCGAILLWTGDRIL